MKLDKHLITEAKKGYSNDEVADIIENEGLGYAIESYLGYKDIDDPKLAKAWKQAEDAISKIQKILR